MKKVVLLTIFFELIYGIGNSQQLTYDVAYYKIIEEIIAQDTIVPAWRARMIAGRVKNGALTRADSIKYYNVIKNRKLLLYYKKANQAGKQAINDDLADRAFLKRHFSEIELKHVVANVPMIDGTHERPTLDDKIELIQDFPKWQIYHKFSAPIWVRDSSYLVYHFRAGVGPTSFQREFILFSVGDSLIQPSYVIEKRIVTHMH